MASHLTTGGHWSTPSAHDAVAVITTLVVPAAVEAVAVS